jgi:hypothetical protein
MSVPFKKVASTTLVLISVPITPTLPDESAMYGREQKFCTFSCSNARNAQAILSKKQVLASFKVLSFASKL